MLHQGRRRSKGTKSDRRSSAVAMNLCSKCCRDFRITEEHAAPAKAAMDKLDDGFRVEIRAGSSSSAVKTAVESSAAVVRAAGVESVNQAETKAVNRCFSCKKKVGVLGFKCSVLVNHELLRGMAEKNLFSWTALISGLVQSGQWIDGFNLFIEMRRAGVDIVDPFILSSIVGASANLAALELGKQIHC